MKAFPAIVVFGVLLLLTGCPPRTGITGLVLEAPTTLISGEMTALRATVQGRGNFDPGVVWRVDGGGSFSDTSANPVDYTAPVVTAETTVTVTVTAVGNPSRSAGQQIAIVLQEPLVYEITPDVTPAQPSLPDGEGNPQPVAGSRDNNGVQSDFIVGHVLIRPESDAVLSAFLARYDGTIIGDNTVPEPPVSLGIELTPDDRKATEYLVAINLSRVNPDSFADDAAAIGMGGFLEVSSQDGLLTLAAITNAAANGFDASPNYVAYPSQPFPLTLLRTEERPAGGGFRNAFDTTRFQTTGSRSNVTLAWQFVAARGIQRRVTIAIIDEGFLLDTAGNPIGTDSDFPAIVGQYDFPADDYIAAGPGTTGCGAGNPCFWHGTGAASVAAGVLNNRRGAAGTGGLVADVMLFKRGGTRANDSRAVRTAVAWGADVVSMSYGGDCDSVACRQLDRRNHPFRDAVSAGSRAVFIASAGNGRDPDGTGPQPAVGYDVGDPSFVHPCIMDHVICVGALDDDAVTRIGYSNFGAGVDIFAPTNIPVMARPAGNDSNPSGTLIQGTFGGTSAAAPFVAGVVAMMKAINPDLSSDQISQILRDTAHKGNAPVTHYIDAYAAVHRAADGIEGVRDRFEPNSLIAPRQLPGSSPWNNLNLHSPQDRDYYRLLSPQRSIMRIDLVYPEGLGSVPWLGLDGSDACGAATLRSDAPLAGGGRRLEYTVAAGNHLLSLGGGLINAYNLAVSFNAAAPLAQDIYEPNNSAATARHLYSFRRSREGLFFALDPTVTITANLHTSSDVDFYTVTAAQVSSTQQAVMNARPVVEVYGHESPMALEVYRLNDDGSQGALVERVSSQSCAGDRLAVVLESGKGYLLSVSGTAGRYSLNNGVKINPPRLPEWVRERHYLVLNPGDPIEQVIRTPLIYILTGDKAFRNIDAVGDVRLELFDMNQTRLAESSQGSNPRLSLAATRRNELYALQVTPNTPTEAGTTLQLSWDSAEIVRLSDNLIRNGDAEEGPANDAGGEVSYIDSWAVPSDFVDQPTVIYYNGVNNLPDDTAPGPEDRGYRFFAGGPSTTYSVIQQEIDMPDAWRDAAENGTVTFQLTGFLGGRGDETDHAVLRATFYDRDFMTLGTATLGPVTAGQREGQTGLFYVTTSDYVPGATQYIYLDLEFRRFAGEYNDGYADNLELRLVEYRP